MISLEQRIINYVNANQPVTAGQASNSLNISKKIFIEIKHNLEKKDYYSQKEDLGFSETLTNTENGCNLREKKECHQWGR